MYVISLLSPNLRSIEFYFQMHGLETLQVDDMLLAPYDIYLANTSKMLFLDSIPFEHTLIFYWSESRNLSKIAERNGPNIRNQLELKRRRLAARAKARNRGAT